MVISRRALLAGGLAAGVVVAAGATGRLDDAVRAVGVRPRPRPRSADVSLARAVIEDQRRVLAIARGTSGADDIAAVLAAQLEQLGGEPAAEPATGDLTGELTEAAQHRAADAAAATSPEFVTVLAAMAAGLDQLAVAWGGRG